MQQTLMLLAEHVLMLSDSKSGVHRRLAYITAAWS